MQATGLSPPLLNFKSMTTPRAEAFPDQDLFKSLLQERIVSRDFSGANSLNRSVLKPQVRQAKAVETSSPWLTRSPNSSRRSSSSTLRAGVDQNQGSVDRKSSTTEAAATAKGQRSSQPNATKSTSPSWRAASLKKAAKFAQGDSQVANPAPLPNTEMPAALKGLIDLLNQQPGQALQVPTNRLPEVEAFLLQAGLPAEQVERLINSPNLQEQGLTAQNVKAAWQQAVQNSLQQALEANGAQISGNPGQKSLANAEQITSLQNLTKQSDFQEMWKNLTLPTQSLSALRQELQQLGVPAESLAELNNQNFPKGIPLTQVWQYIQQAPKAPPGAVTDPATTAAASKSPVLLSGAKDMENWRQLLVQAGMEPELAQTLTEGATPANREELRGSLMTMAPPQASPQEQDIPKPLYLPENVRVRQVPLLQQTDIGQGQGQGGGNSNLAQNFAFSAKAQEASLPVPANLPGTADLNNFLALLTDGGLKADQAAPSGVPGTQSTSVNAFLTPEAKEAIWSQVQSGVMGNLRPGENQITLTLNPPDLGKLELTLNLKGAQVEVTAVTAHPAVAEAAASGVQQLVQALNQQGLILTQFNFHHQDEAQGQPQLAFSQNQGGDQKQAGQKDPDKWEKPATPRRRWNGGIDCFA